MTRSIGKDRAPAATTDAVPPVDAVPPPPPRGGAPAALALLRRYQPPQRYIPVLATAVVLAAMYAVGSANYRGFSHPQVLLNVLIDNSFLFVIAVGMTFVILTGGIDLSVGAVVALTTVLSATFLEDLSLPAFVVVPLVLSIGATLGLGMGSVIHYFNIQPFIVTLAGMFLARGICHAVTNAAIPIRDPFWTRMGQTNIPFGNLFIKPSVVIAAGVVVVGVVILAYSRLGRTVYAIGGNQQSALLMGLPVARTKIAVYTFSGLCSAMGGVLFSFYLPSGDPLHGIGMELDVIAAVVIGGTLLTGGSGYVVGTVLGVLTLGVIKTILIFEGSLSAWWSRIVVGILLFAFILLQRLVVARRR